MSRPDDHLVDVIVPTYNRPELTAEAIRSVREQTFSSWRLLLVDDASDSSDAAALVARAGSDERVRLIRRKRNGGQQLARQTGLDHSDAPWVALLDSDDVWLPTKLERQLELAERGRRGEAILCWHRWQASDGADLGIRRPHVDSRERLISSNLSTLLAPREMLLQAGGFLVPGCEPIRNWHGVDLYLRLMAAGGFAVVEEPLVICRAHPGSRASDTFATAQAARDFAAVLDANAAILQERPVLRAHLRGRLATRWSVAGRPGRALRCLARALRGASWGVSVQVLRRFGPAMVRLALRRSSR